MEEIDVKEIVDVFIKKIYIVILVTVIGALLGLLYSKVIVTPKYRSTTSFVLSKAVDETTTQVGAITQNDITLNQKLVSTYSEIIKSKTIAKQVIENLGLEMSEEEFISNVSVTAKDDTELLLITVTNTDPVLSADIANSLVEVFRGKISEVYKIENLSVIDVAEPAESPYNIGIMKNMTLFGAVSFILSCGIIFLIVCFDNTVKKQEEIEKLLQIPVIASIPIYEAVNGGEAYGK